MIVEYYAHTSHSGNEKLIDHLMLTAELAALNGKSFGHSKLCYQLGLLHDIGKHTLNFQKVLTREESKQDHAIVAGMVYNACDHNSCAWLREHMALIMSCHHSYLYNDNKDMSINRLLSEKYNLEIFKDYNGNKLSKITKDNDKHVVVSDAEEYDNIKAYVRNEKLLLPITAVDHFDISNMSENEKMFYTRMLYSCLVDADYSATSIYCDNKSRSDFENKVINSEFYSEKLHKYHDDLIANSDSKSEINKLRQQVYNSCHAKGSELSGFVTLTAPTGTGKTLALMEFALEQAKKFNKDRVFVVLPFLSIINQNAKIYKDIFGDDAVLVDDSQTEFTEKTRLESERWSAEIIVTTSVKFFETLFASKATNVRRLHNVSNSVVVFDECQTLPSELLNSTIEVLQTLTKYYNTTVLFSTATKPAYEYRNHNEFRDDRILLNMQWQASEITDDIQTVFDRYDKIKNTDVVFDTSHDYTCDDLINYFNNHNSVLYVFNTVKHARCMYDALIAKYGENSDVCYLITSQFCAVDKQHIIDTVNARLKAGKPVMLAATQCIEAGVDFDFPVGAREYAPLDSIIQAAGRVCRNGKRHGDFLVFRYEEHGQYDYPTPAYKTASEVSLIHAKKNSDINLYDLSVMNSYFKDLYTNTRSYKNDIPELYDGYDRDCYKHVSDNYRMIKDQGNFMVIVKPICDDVKFAGVLDRILRNNYVISKADMKILSQYSISVHGSKSVDPCVFASQLYLNKEGNAINWFLLNDVDAYTEKGFSATTAMSGGFFGLE